MRSQHAVRAEPVVTKSTEGQPLSFLVRGNLDHGDWRLCWGELNVRFYLAVRKSCHFYLFKTNRIASLPRLGVSRRDRPLLRHIFLQLKEIIGGIKGRVTLLVQLAALGGSHRFRVHFSHIVPVKLAFSRIVSPRKIRHHPVQFGAADPASA